MALLLSQALVYKYDAKVTSKFRLHAHLLWARILGPRLQESDELRRYCTDLGHHGEHVVGCITNIFSFASRTDKENSGSKRQVCPKAMTIILSWHF